jgi:hypothetical protein
MFAIAMLLLGASETPSLKVVVVEGRVEVRGYAAPTAERAKTLKLLVDGTPEELAKRPAVAGVWSVAGKSLQFEPQFPLAAGVKYRITGDLPQALVFEIPKPPPGPPVRIAAVFPSAGLLPENTLRFYVHFTGQITHGSIYKHVKLIRDDGVEVPRPFLELDEELWSADGLRVTMLFHPGRVKRELVPREQDGPILEGGRTFTLVFTREWKDAEGRPLAQEHRKTFRVGPPEEAGIDLNTWSMMAPRAGSTEPLIVRLAKPADRALLASTLSVVDASGKSIAGEVTVGGGERVVTFNPAAPWSSGGYRLVVDRRLEDMCGNRVDEPFEVDATTPKREAKRDKPFSVK